jgi:cobalt-zinc-cadmium efflux system protein
VTTHHPDLSHVPAWRVGLAAALTLAAGLLELGISAHAGSLFLLADAVHLLAHLGIFLVLLLPPGRFHGEGEDVATVAVLVVVTAIAVWITLKSLRSLMTLPDVPPSAAAMLVSVVGLGANLVSAFLFRRPAATHFSFRAALAHELLDGGMTVAGWIGAGFIALFGWRWVDPALSLFIGGWLGLWAARLLFRRAREGAGVFFNR